MLSNFSFKRRFQTESKGSTPQRLTPNPEPSFLCCLLTYLYAKIRYYSELSIYGVKKPIEWVVYISQEI